MAMEIVSFPIYHGDFTELCNSHYQRVRRMSSSEISGSSPASLLKMTMRTNTCPILSHPVPVPTLSASFRIFP